MGKPFQKCDSKFSVWATLDNQKQDKNELVKKWTNSYFSDQLPDTFKIDLDEFEKISGCSINYDYKQLIFLKSYKSSLNFKILHPAAFKMLLEVIYNQIFACTPSQLNMAWKHKNVYYAS